MKTQIKLTLLLCMALFSLLPYAIKAQTGGTPSSATLSGTEPPAYQKGKLYLKIKNSSSFDLAGYPSAPVMYDADLLSIMNNYGVTKVEKPFQAFGTPTFDRTYRITFTDEEHADDLIAALGGLSFIEYSEKVPAMYEHFVSNDPIQPYHLALMNANGASNIHISAGTSVVAVVDDAVLTTHLDLAANIGLANQDVADLDANPNPPLAGPVIVSPSTFSHGTHVAGIAGGVTNNAYGVASIGWNNTIMAVKTRKDNDPSTGIPFGYDGITWAATHGANVINCSWGGSAYSLTEYNVVVAAHALNVVIVVSAGNNYTSTAAYPAAYGEGTTGQVWEVLNRKLVIAVAGLDSGNDRSYWGLTFMGPSGSNAGYWVDISAYGTAITSSVGDALGGLPVNTQFATWNGTSMAAPQISGVAGIMRSYNTVATADEIYDCLVYTANPDIYNTTLHPTNTPGTLGTGRVDAEAALQCINEVCPSTVAVIIPSSYTLCPASSVTLTANTGIGYAWSTGANTQSINVTTAGTYSVTVTFAGGCTSTTSVTITNVSTTPLTLDVTDNSGYPNDGIICGPGSSSNGFSFCASAWGTSYSWSSFGFMGWGQCSGGMSLGATVPDAFTMCITVNNMYGCPGLNDTACATITAVNPPVVAVTPAASTICAGQPVTLTASGASTYSWAPSTGLSATTGAVVIASPTTTTTYTVTGVNAVTGCEDTQTVTITVTNPVVVAFSYTGSPYCNTAPNPFPTLASGGVAGTFSSTAGLVFVSTSTGQINLAASTPGTYTVTNTIPAAGGCPAVTATSTITIDAPVAATFSYVGSPFCTTAANPLPVFSGGGVAGTFSSTPGLVFVSTTTGQINLLASTPGTYTITNTVSGGACPNAVATTSITINSCAGICTSCPATLDSYAPGGVLSTSPPGLQTYCLLGNISISGAVNIALSEVGIAPGVTITVNPGATLTITGSHLYSCSDMWQGIVVKPGGRVSVQNFVLFSTIWRTSLIEDAMVAIDVQAGSTVTTNLVNINNATFNRNQIGLRVAGYQPALATYPFTIVNSVFTSRALAFTFASLAWPQTNAIKATYAVFNPLQTPYINDVTYPDNTAGAFLKPPFLPLTNKPLAHISLNKVGQTINPATTPTYYEMKIGTAGVPNYNVFDNMNVGIDALNSNFTCVNNVFQRTISRQKNTAAINAVANEVFNCRMQAIPAAATNFINKFYDCNISINATNYFEVNARYCDVRSLQNFSTMYNLAHRGQNGFVVNTNRYIAINLSDNTFSNIEFAIGFTTNNSFYSVGPWTSGSGQYSGQVDINQNTFQPFITGSPLANAYLDRAIVANNVTGTTHFINTTQTVNTNNNQVNNVFRGIRCNNWQRKSVITNNNAVSIIPTPSSPTAIQYGISHANNLPLNPMSNNIISNVVSGYGITNPNLVGIATQLCNNQVVNCNTTRNVTMGIYFAGNEMPTVFKFNTFDNSGANRHKYAFVLDNNGFIGPQGAAGSPSGNSWSPVANWTPGVNYKTATLGGSYAWNGSSGSPLWVRNTPATQNPSGTLFNYSSSGSLFEYNVLGAINTTSGITLLPCAIIPHISIPSPLLIQAMEKVAKDEIPYSVNEQATKIIGKNQLFRMLKNDPSYLSSSTDLQNFYNQSLTTYREDFSAIEENLVNGDYLNAQSRVNGLTLGSDIESHYKDFYNLYLRQQTDSLGAEDSIQLFTIASGCPFTDGAIVYQARAMFNSVYDINKDFEDHCVNVESRNMITETESVHTFDAEVFPNPSSGEIFINPTGILDEVMEVVVKDVNGRIVYNQSLQFIEGMLNFKLNVNNGVYFVSITNTTNHETIVKKLVIQK